MNYLFTFNQSIDVHALLEFEMFCWELDEIVCITTSANDNDEGAEFPPNFILVYADTENQNHLDSITNKYNRLVNESAFIESTKLTIEEGNLQ